MSVVIYGYHPVCEAVQKRPGAVHRLLVSTRRRDTATEHIASRAGRIGIPVLREHPRVLSRAAGSEHHQGIVAYAEPFPLQSLETVLDRCSGGEGSMFLLVLDGIQDPHNFGALLRSAVCCGVQAVVFPKDRSAPLSGTVAKASAGAVEHITLCRVVNIAAALDSFKTNDIWTVAMTPRARETIYSFDFRRDLALVVGGEGKGLRPLVQKKCDLSLSIPLAQSFESLNASVAGAVVMFEVLRQRRYA